MTWGIKKVKGMVQQVSKNLTQNTCVFDNRNLNTCFTAHGHRPFWIMYVATVPQEAMPSTILWQSSTYVPIYLLHTHVHGVHTCLYVHTYVHPIRCVCCIHCVLCLRVHTVSGNGCGYHNTQLMASHYDPFHRGQQRHRDSNIKARKRSYGQPQQTVC